VRQIETPNARYGTITSWSIGKCFWLHVTSGTYGKAKVKRDEFKSLEKPSIAPWSLELFVPVRSGAVLRLPSYSSSLVYALL
jgi:hypothetical protein